MTNPQEPMNRELRRMSSKMGYDPKDKRAQAKQAGQKSKKPTLRSEKRNIFMSIIVFFKECWRELKKVSWPTRKEVINMTIVVLVCTILVILLVLVVDYGAERLADLIYS